MKIWLHVDGRQLGPYELHEVPMDKLTPNTPVWYEGLASWTAAGNAPATAHLFAAPTPASAPAAAEDPHPAADVADEDPQPELDTVPEPEHTHPQPAPQPRPEQVAASYAGYVPQQSATGDEPKCPPSYLWWSIALTICCCNPVGIVPIIIGSSVTSKYRNHDYEGALKASRLTEWWVIITFVLGLMMLPFSFIIYS